LTDVSELLTASISWSLLIALTHLFIYSLFNDAFSITQTIQRQMKEDMDELERLWKEEVVA
jgi:hypothetical protein